MERSITRRFTDIVLCEHFHWTPDIIANLPSDFYDDLMLVLLKKSAKQKIEMEKLKNQSTK